MADPDGAGLDETKMSSSSDALGVGLPLRLRFRAGSFGCVLVDLGSAERVFLACSSFASRRMSGLYKPTSRSSSNWRGSGAYLATLHACTALSTAAFFRRWISDASFLHDGHVELTGSAERMH